jgi:hypothetical protein
MIRKNSDIKIEFNMWGKSYNILRVISGMAGLAFYK